METTQRQVPQAAWAGQLNLSGKMMGAELIVPLETKQLLADACTMTGLSDYGDEHFKEGLQVLVKSLNEEAQLNLTGRLLVSQEIRRVLQSRLRVIEFEKQHPEVHDEVIETPIFIIGMGRTGSTILHEYLAHDPHNRAPLVWEMRLPCPIDPSLSVEDDIALRRAISDAESGIQYEIDRSLITKHEQRADLPEECSQLMAYEFTSGHFFSRCNIPSYAAWNATTNVKPALEMHKRILKVLQFQSGKQQRWVLKYGGHMPYIPTLLETYPDARLIHTHRYPVEVVKSFVSLMASTRLARSDSFDPEAASEMLNGGMSRIVEKIIGDRESDAIPASQIADLHFKDLMEHGVAALEKTYQALGLSLSEEAKVSIEKYRSERPRSKHGAHEYAYAEAVDLDKERQRYAKYVEYYGITPSK